MADRTVRVRLGADISDYLAKMQQAAAATENSVAKSGAAWGKVSTGLMAGGAGVLALAGSMVKGFADFDAQMSNVAASTGASASELAKLKEAAMAAGAEFGQFTSTDAAGALEELGKAGLSTEASIAALRGTMGLAAADNMEVGRAAEITAQALTMFAREGVTATQVADGLAQAAGAAVGSAEELGQGLGNVGPLAASMGISFRDTTQMLALFAQNGIRGAEGGTQLKSMLMHLQNPSKAAARAMAEMGLQAYDATGKFVGMESLIGQLETKTKGMTQQQKDQALATIFGTHAVLGANVAMKEGVKGYTAMGEAMAGFGSAADMAAKRTDNLKGDLAEVGGAWENLLIKTGEAGNGPLRSMLQDLTAMLEFAGRHQGVTQAVMGVATGLGAVALTAGGVMKVTSAVSDFRASWKTLSADFPKGTSRMQALGKAALVTAAAVGVASLAFSALDRHAMRNVASTEQMRQSLLRMAQGGRGLDEINTSIASMGTQVKDLGGTFDYLNEKSGWSDKVGKKLGAAIPNVLGAKSATTKYREELDKLDQTLTQMSAKDAAAAFNRILKETGKSAAEVAPHLDAYANKLRGIASELGVTVSDSELVDWMGGKVPAAVAKTAAAAQAAGRPVSTLAGGLGTLEEKAAEAEQKVKALANGLLQLSGSEIGLESAIDDATASIKDNGKTLDINTAKGRANRSALDNIASSALALRESQEKAGRSTVEMNKSTDRARTAFVDVAVKMGMTKKAAEQLATQYGLVPTKVETKVTQPGGKESERQAKALATAYAALPGVKATAVSAPGARPSTFEVDKLRAAINSVPPSKQAHIRTIAELSGVEAARRAIESLKSKTVTATIRYQTTGAPPGMSSLLAHSMGYADGGILRHYANGGMERHIAQIAPAGAWRVWAEDETGGEAYIPLAPSKRQRSLDILEEVAAIFGHQLLPNASGNVYAAPSIPSRMPAPSVPRSITYQASTSDPSQWRITLEVPGLAGAVDARIVSVTAGQDRGADLSSRLMGV